MTTAVTKESLAARIADLEPGARSLKEDYTLAAYKMLLATMEAEPVGIVRYVGTSERKSIHVSLYQQLPEGVELFAAQQPAQISDPIVDIFVAEVVKNLVNALDHPIVLGPVTVSDGINHVTVEHKVLESLRDSYPMFDFIGSSGTRFLQINILKK